MSYTYHSKNNVIKVLYIFKVWMSDTYHSNSNVTEVLYIF